MHSCCAFNRIRECDLSCLYKHDFRVCGSSTGRMSFRSDFRSITVHRSRTPSFDTMQYAIALTSPLLKLSTPQSPVAFNGFWPQLVLNSQPCAVNPSRTPQFRILVPKITSVPQILVDFPGTMSVWEAISLILGMTMLSFPRTSRPRTGPRSRREIEHATLYAS